jgi:5'-3' exonuclease
MNTGDPMKVALLDGYNLMHRARFGMRQGESYIVFNFFRSLRPIIEEINPDLVYLVLEGVPMHRVQLDADYKANRVVEEGTPQAAEMAEFRRQKRLIIEALSMFPITLAKHDELECDDTIASLCVDVHGNDECTVVSTDTDFIQLLKPGGNVKLYNPVKKEYVVPVEHDYVIWKALRGDKTDNIPRVDGMTDGKALKIVNNLDKLEEVKRDLVLGPQFERNLTLVRFKTGDNEHIKLTRGAPDFAKARTTFRDFKFFSMVNDTAWKNYTKTFQRLLDKQEN